MRQSLVFLTFTSLIITYVLSFQANAAPVAPLIKQLSSILKWTRSSYKTPLSDGNVLQFENGYLVETVVEGNELGVVPYSIRVLGDGELFAVDAVNSNIVKITPPLSHYSRARLVAGSSKGNTGHVDGKPSEACFNRPKGVAMDDKGNVYVADTLNLAIRKIGEAGVTTIAGGKSNVAGFRDGPSEDAKFSSDFDVVYVKQTCSLLVVDRGNAALRQISLNRDDCDHQYNSISPTDILMVIGAILIGYAACLLQQGFGPSFIFTTPSSGSEYQDTPWKKKVTPLAESVKDEPVAGWPSFGQLIIDLSKLALEASANMFQSFIPSIVRSSYFISKKGLTPLQDTLRMPEDEPVPPLVQKHRSSAPLTETRQAQKVKSASSRDPSLSSKHRSSKRQEYAEFYGSGEIPPSYSQSRSKSQKDRSRHRQRDKNGEFVYGSAGVEPKPVEVNKPVNYDDQKYNVYSMRSKYGPSDDSFRF